MWGVRIFRSFYPDERDPFDREFVVHELEKDRRVPGNVPNSRAGDATEPKSEPVSVPEAPHGLAIAASAFSGGCTPLVVGALAASSASARSRRPLASTRAALRHPMKAGSRHRPSDPRHRFLDSRASASSGAERKRRTVRRDSAPRPRPKRLRHWPSCAGPARYPTLQERVIPPKVSFQVAGRCGTAPRPCGGGPFPGRVASHA